MLKLSTLGKTRLKFQSWVTISAVLGLVVVWSALSYAFRDILIYHDSWNTNFTEIYGIARNSACGRFAYWLTTPDLGSETVVYAISISLTHPFRAFLVALWSCTRPEPFDAMMAYRFQIFAIYLVFAFGMFVLGRIVFRHWLTPVYLFASTLFAGLAMEMVHSDQHAVLVFWVPWCATAGVLAHRHGGSPRGLFYFNLAALFFCIALNEQQPHAPALAVATAFLIYGAFNFAKVLEFAARWVHLWPAVLLLCICLAGFFIIKGRIFEYLPSQHAQITTDPSDMGETGFAQLPSLLGTLFPLSFASAADDIQQGGFWRAYNFRLDVLIFYVGTVPFLLLLSLIPRPELRGATRGWLIFSGVMLLVAWQKTGIYYALYHLPSFDLFRNYFFFFDYAVVGVLVLSGFGFDRLVTAPQEKRSGILRATSSLAIALFALGATAIAIQKTADTVIAVLTFIAVASGLSITRVGMSVCRGGSEDPKLNTRGWCGFGLTVVLAAAAVTALAIMLRDSGWLNHWKAIAGDAIILGAALSGVYWVMNSKAGGLRQGITMIAVLVMTQSLYVAGVFSFVGEPARTTFDRYRMGASLLTPYSAVELADPARLDRVSCPTNGACYLAQRPAVSWKRDLDGTFLRHRSNPVFQKELSPEARKAVLTGPILWASAGLKSLPSLSALNALIEENKGHLGEFLDHATYVIGAPANSTDETSGSSQIGFTDWESTANRISFRYRAREPGVVNLGVQNSSHWKGTIDGSPARLISGNYDTISIRVSAGEGLIVLHYDDLPSRLYFWSRWLMDFLAVVGLGFVIRGSWSLPSEAVRSRN